MIFNERPELTTAIRLRCGPLVDVHGEQGNKIMYVAQQECVKQTWLVGWLKCCFTSTETVGLLGTGAQDVHLDFQSKIYMKQLL